MRAFALIVVVAASAACTEPGTTPGAGDSVTYAIEIGLLPAGASVTLDGMPVVSRQILTYSFDSLDALLAWSTVADVQTTSTRFQVVVRATDAYARGCNLPGRVTLIDEVWELDSGQTNGPLMFWTGSGHVEVDGHPACGWTY